MCSHKEDRHKPLLVFWHVSLFFGALPLSNEYVVNEWRAWRVLQWVTFLVFNTHVTNITRYVQEKYLEGLERTCGQIFPDRTPMQSTPMSGRL